MADAWFVKMGGKEQGPLSFSQLRQLADQGRITARSGVRRGSSVNWFPARNVDGLFGGSVGPPPISLPTPNQSSSVRLHPTHAASLQLPAYLWAGIGGGVVLVIVLTGLALSSRDRVSEAVAHTSPAAPDVFTPDSYDQQMKSTSAPPAAEHSEESHSTGSDSDTTETANTPSNEQFGEAGLGSGKQSPKEAGTEAGDASLAAVLSTEQVVAMCEPSVALIEGLSGSGTGFLIEGNVVATNRHVIEGEFVGDLKVSFPSAPQDKRGPHSAELLYIDESIDFALLSVSVSLPPLQGEEDHTFRRGQDILVIGNPGFGLVNSTIMKNAVSRGVMSSQIDIDGVQYDQLGMSLNGGNSGGPVLNRSGRVIGVATSVAIHENDVSFAIPINAVRASITQAGTMTDADIARIRSFHRARVVFHRVEEAASRYQSGMHIYVGAMLEALNKGQNASEGIAGVRSTVEAGLSEIDRGPIADLDSELSSVSRDQRIPDSARTALVDFWTNYREMKRHATPRGTFDSYTDKLNELSDKHERLAESLKLLLGAME